MALGRVLAPCFPMVCWTVFQEEKEKEKVCISFLFLKESHVLGLGSMYYPC